MPSQKLCSIPEKQPKPGFPRLLQAERPVSAIAKIFPGGRQEAQLVSGPSFYAAMCG